MPEPRCDEDGCNEPSIVSRKEHLETGLPHRCESHFNEPIGDDEMTEQVQENATREPAVGSRLDLPRIVIRQTEKGLKLYVEDHDGSGPREATLVRVDENTRTWDGLEENAVKPHVWGYIWALLENFEMVNGEAVALSREDVKA